jgi:hypothetical protein
VEHSEGAPLLDKLLTLLKDIELSKKSLSVTNTLAYFVSSLVMPKSFITLTPGPNAIKPFMVVFY